MSDSFSAPVHKARAAWLATKVENLSAIIKIELSKPLDSIVIHNLADDLEGLSRDFRLVVETSIEEYQEALGTVSMEETT